MVRIRFALAAITLTIAFASGCGVSTPPASIATQQSSTALAPKFDYVFVNEQFADYAAVRDTFSVEAFAIDKDGNVAAIPGTQSMTGPFWQSIQFFTRGNRLFFSPQPGQLATYSVSSSGINQLGTASFGAGPNNTIQALISDPSNSVVFGSVNGSDVQGFHVGDSGTLSPLPALSEQFWADLIGDFCDVAAISLAPDGKTAFVDVSCLLPHAEGVSEAIYAFARDTETGALTRRTFPSLSFGDEGGFAVLSGGYVMMPGAPDPNTSAAFAGPGLYRVNADSSLTFAGPGLSGYRFIFADADGQFVYGLQHDAATSSDVLDRFSFDPEKAAFSKAASVALGDVSKRAWALTTSGRYVMIGADTPFTQHGSSFTVYAIDWQSGTLTPKATISTPSRIFGFQSSAGDQ